MNYNELLKKVSPNIQLGTDYPSWDALRAVVELHYQDDYQSCQECKQSLDPCLTIQTIEKVLND